MISALVYFLNCYLSVSRVISIQTRNAKAGREGVGMKTSKWLIACFIMIFAALLPFKAEAQAGLEILDVRFGNQPGGVRAVIEINQPTDFRAFVLDSPYRAVVDLPAARWLGPASKASNGKVIAGYRSGKLEAGLSRLVIDLNEPVLITRAFTLPKEGKMPHRLVLDMAPASLAHFQAKRSKVHGNPDIGAKPTPVLSPSPSPTAVSAAVRAVPSKKPSAASAPKAKRKYVIVLDPGHGGGDPGAVGPGNILEKNITLSLSRELRRQLEATGRYKVEMTRDRDVYIRLRDRVNLARKVNGDLFISIHADKIARTNVRGASIYTLSERGSDAETERLAQDENFSGVVAGVDIRQEGDDVAGILLDLAMREKMTESTLLSEKLEGAMRTNGIRLLQNARRSAGFAVLKAPDIPSVLIEAGFLSNPAEAKLLVTADFQRRLSTAIVHGIDTYFRKIESLNRD